MIPAPPRSPRSIRRPEHTMHQPPPMSRYWLIVVAFLFFAAGVDHNRWMPYFTPLSWSLLYFFVASNILLLFHFGTRNWLLRASSAVIAVSFLRGVCYLIYDQRITTVSLNFLIVVLTWAFYKLRVADLPDPEGKKNK